MTDDRQNRPKERRSGPPGGSAADRGAGAADAPISAVLAELHAYAVRYAIPAPELRKMVMAAIYLRSAFSPPGTPGTFQDEDPAVVASISIDALEV